MDKPNFFKDLPTWAKGVIAVAITGGAAFGLYKGYAYVSQNLKERKDAEDKKKKYEEDNRYGIVAGNELDALQKKGVNPTLTSSQALNFASRLKATLDGCGYNMTAVMDVMSKMKNTADVLLLVSSYGYRNFRPCLATTPLSAMVYMFKQDIYGGTLPELMAVKLKQEDIEKINNLFKSKGISYQL